MEEAADDAVLATDTLKAGGDPEVLFPARTSPLCSYCDFRRSCPQGGAAAPDAQPWSLLCAVTAAFTGAGSLRRGS